MEKGERVIIDSQEVIPIDGYASFFIGLNFHSNGVPAPLNSRSDYLTGLNFAQDQVFLLKKAPRQIVRSQEKELDKLVLLE